MIIKNNDEIIEGLRSQPALSSAVRAANLHELTQSRYLEKNDVMNRERHATHALHFACIKSDAIKRQKITN